MWLTIWILMAYGMSQILVYGSIFESLRAGLYKWGADEHAPFQSLGEFLSGLISCPLCFSTWGGFVLSLLVFSPTNHIFNTPLGYSWFFDGITSAGAVWAINGIIEWFEENRPTKD